MAAWNPEPVALRASDSDRERVIQALRDGSVQGRLSYDTFVRRMELALHARDHGQLAALLHDLPAAGGRSRLATVISWWSAVTARAQAAWRAPRYQPLVLPSGTRTGLTIGRAADSDLVLRDQTVSWRHAELRRHDGEWVLADLGSTNGTRVNGWRVGGGLTVRPGDRVSFGQLEFRLTDRSA